MMKKALYSLIITLVIYLSIGILIARYTVSQFPYELASKVNEQYQDYSGALHLDGTASLSDSNFLDLISDAQQANLDFIFIDQLNSFEVLPKDQINENLLVFFTQKVSYLKSHLLLINKNPFLPFEDLNMAQIYLTDQFTGASPKKELFSALLHPKKQGYEWSSAKYPELIETLNLKSIWYHSYLKSRLSFLWTILIYPFNTELAIVRLLEDAATEELSLYDSITEKNISYGFCGIHAKPKISLGSFQFPSYKTLFSACKNHVLLKGELTGNIENDRAKIFEALKRGQSYYSIDLLGDPKGFYAEASNNTSVYPLGSELSLDDSTKISIHIPKQPQSPMEVVVFKNKKRVFTSNSLNSVFHIHDPGVYRIQVRVIPTFPLPDGKKWITWIYTNPFFIR